ncbi:MAG: hypothetical protein CMI26_09975 [Opitutae bacterium]|nr:hypothetical protein [Opitutae bacterium]
MPVTTKNEQVATERIQHFSLDLSTVRTGPDTRGNRTKGSLEKKSPDKTTTAMLRMQESQCREPFRGKLNYRSDVINGFKALGLVLPPSRCGN